MKKNISICSDFRIPIFSSSTLWRKKIVSRNTRALDCDLLVEKNIANFSNFISQPCWTLLHWPRPRAYAEEMFVEDGRKPSKRKRRRKRKNKKCVYSRRGRLCRRRYKLELKARATAGGAEGGGGEAGGE